MNSKQCFFLRVKLAFVKMVRIFLCKTKVAAIRIYKRLSNNLYSKSLQPSSGKVGCKLQLIYKGVIHPLWPVVYK